jgi:hypothetical protein
LLGICFAPSLADSFIFLTLTRLVVVFIFVNFSFALFTPPPSRRLSAAVVVERREEGHALLIQRPVYFISEVLSETKICYPQIQKLLYTVILTRRKL